MPWKRNGVYEKNILRFFETRDHAVSDDIIKYLADKSPYRNGGKRYHIPNPGRIKSILLKNGFTIKRIRVYRKGHLSEWTTRMNVYYKPGCDVMTKTVNTNDVETVDTSTVYDKASGKNGNKYFVCYIPTGVSKAISLKSGDVMQWIVMKDGTVRLFIKNKKRR